MSNMAKVMDETSTAISWGHLFHQKQTRRIGKLSEYLISNLPKIVAMSRIISNGIIRCLTKDPKTTSCPTVLFFKRSKQHQVDRIVVKMRQDQLRTSLGAKTRAWNTTVSQFPKVLLMAMSAPQSFSPFP
jgi:hypothetical protein